MSALEEDGIGEAVIVGNQIMIPVGDIIYSGELSFSFMELVTLMEAGTSEGWANNALKIIKMIDSKFSPEGIFNQIRHPESANWIMETFLKAYKDTLDPPKKEE